jgi:hypothetical protein
MWIQSVCAFFCANNVRSSPLPPRARVTPTVLYALIVLVRVRRSLIYPLGDDDIRFSVVLIIFPFAFRTSVTVLSNVFSTFHPQSHGRLVNTILSRPPFARQTGSRSSISPNVKRLSQQCEPKTNRLINSGGSIRCPLSLAAITGWP